MKTLTIKVQGDTVAAIIVSNCRECGDPYRREALFTADTSIGTILALLETTERMPYTCNVCRGVSDG